VNINEEDVFKAAMNIYNDLQAAGGEVIFDDRDERAGVKFKDADLIGIPLRITVGRKNLLQGNVELKIRKSGETKIYPLQMIVSEIKKIVAEGLNTAAQPPEA
jgi:prolyl-tRNA synthetase